MFQLIEAGAARWPGAELCPKLMMQIMPADLIAKPDGNLRNDDRARWVCARTHPKHEHIAAAHLARIPGVEVFNPRLRIERRTRRGRMRARESLFVNYVFANFTFELLLERVRYTPGIKSMVQFGGRLAVIPDNVIEDLRATIAQNADVVFSDSPVVGDEAEVVEGPFRGEKIRIARILPAHERVEALMEVLGRSVPVEFNLSSLIFPRRPAAQRIFGAPSPQSARVLAAA